MTIVCGLACFLPSPPVRVADPELVSSAGALVVLFAPAPQGSLLWAVMLKGIIWSVFFSTSDERSVV